MSLSSVRRILWGAFILSLLLHIFTIFSEEIYGWVTRPEFEQTELKEATRKLKSLSLDEDAKAQLAGIKRPEQMTVYLHLPGVPKRIDKSAPKPVQPPLSPVVQPAVPAMASAVQPEARVPTVAEQTASSVVAVAASTPVTLAAASKPVEKINGDTKVASAPVIKSPTTQPGQAQERFPRDIQITYIYGFIPAHLNWKVTGNRYDLQLDGSFLGISRKFVSGGKIDKRGVTPDNFIEYRNGKPEPFYQVDFDWKNYSAEVGEPGKRKTERIVDGDQDIFSSAFHIGLIGGSKPEYTFSIFSGRRKYEDVRMRVAGEAKLRLGGKEVDALLLRGAWDDRQVDFWLAPEWNNIPVRMTVVLGKELSLDIWANEITIEGKKVLEWVKPQGKQPGERGNK